MGKPLNWMLSGIVPAKKAASSSLRNRLAATTILAVVPFLGYGRQAYAACVTPAPAPLTHLCSGTFAGQDINFDNAYVGTAPGLVVQTDGLLISGYGDIRFLDENASSITNTSGAGLYIQSLNDAGNLNPPYAVSVITDGIISGTQHGIAAYNVNFAGTGDLSITVTGDVAGVDVDEAEGDDVIANDGIHALNFNQDLIITTGAGSLVTGEHNAIDARNLGVGDLTINADGALAGYEYDGVFARNHGIDLNITLGAESVVFGAGNGVQALNLGHGNLDITADGLCPGSWR